ncbi:MAG: formate dehydrogenase subunit alpha [Bacteroidales bacterium]|nr:formate dehydrogenase subunit alpha [Bacteroidales bacterium]
MKKRITLTIDGKSISAFAGENLLQVARDHQIDIPGLCYHKKITPTGACRLCVTKVAGTPGLTMACTTAVQEGMVVTAFDPELERNRKHTLDYLLAEHREEKENLKWDELHALSVRYGLDDPKVRSYPSVRGKANFHVDASSPVLVYDASKCIRCFRCIKACDEVQGKNVLSFTERGLDSYIIAGFNHWGSSECDGCGECIQLCPTAALVEKPNREIFHLEKIERKVTTTCPYCGVGCQMELWIQEGKIVRITGKEGVSPNDGRLCIKGRFGYDFVHDASRLTTPLIREHGVFREASWEEALSLIAEKFTSIRETYGADALAGYASAKCTNEDNYLFQKFFRIVIGTNNIDYCTRLCHASTVTAMLKAIGDGAGSNSIEDFETTDCLFVAGNNLIETHPVTATYVKRGKAKGMKIIVVDPKWTPLVRYADIWLQPKSGTDVALINGLMYVIISRNLVDETFIRTRVEGGMQAFQSLKALVMAYPPEKVAAITGVPAEKLISAAILFASSSASMVATGMGMSQQVTGTHNVFSLLNMCLITGQIGKERAGINPPRGQNNVQGATDVGVSPVNYPGYIPVTRTGNRKYVAEVWNVSPDALPGKPGLTTVEIMQAVHRGSVKGMYIMGENPVVTDPNQNHTREALENIDFLVVQDIFPTETTAYANVILPASVWAEKEGTFVNSDRRVLRVRKALELPGEARADWQIILAVAQAMGVSIGTCSDPEAIFDELTRVTPMMAGISYDRIALEGIQWPCPDKDHPGTRTLFLEKFNTPTGKANLHPVDYVALNERVSDNYPFFLNSGRILYHYHSSTMSRKVMALNAFENSSYVLMNPLDAAKYGFTTGERVKVSNARGALFSTLRVSDEVLQHELFMPWHFSGSPDNALTRDELDQYSKNCTF